LQAALYLPLHAYTGDKPYALLEAYPASLIFTAQQ
jgi:hypothetical protein